MKKLLLTIILFFSFIPIINAADIAQNAVSAIIMETTTGKIIYEKNINERLHPASMTKMMTLLLTFESLDNNKITMDDMVNISNTAASMGGSQMFLEANTKVRLEEIIKGVSIASANDGAVALAEYIGGSVDNFVDMMNQKAKDLGLENTHFMNPHGLDANDHYSSAYDMAIIANNLILHKDVLKYTSIYEDYFNKPDGSRTWLVNTNKLVRYYEGVDGLKTGYTESAGYCLTSTAKKNNIRFLTVVMGEPTSNIRTEETTNMLNYAFNSFKLNTIIEENTELGKIKISKGMQDTATLIPKHPITELISTSDDIKNYSYNIVATPINAPVKNGDTVGKIEVIDNDGRIIKEEVLTIKENIEKATYFHILKKNINIILSGK